MRVAHHCLIATSQEGGIKSSDSDGYHLESGRKVDLDAYLTGLKSCVGA